MIYQPCTDADSVAQMVADTLVIHFLRFLKTKGRCHVALPGGTTPEKCLSLLAHKKLPWQLIHWYISDERCLPVGDPDRNDVMLERSLWGPADVPEGNIHPILTEHGAEAGAAHYAELIQIIGNLDIVILGMGEDGHTASLFPDNPALNDNRHVVPVFDAPKAPAERISLSMATIQAADERHIIVTGEAKREAMCQLHKGIDLPAGRIGEAHWYVDEAASCLPG